MQKRKKEIFPADDLHKEKKKVVVAMSGGLDSSVTAALLKKAGFKVTGAFFRFWVPLKRKKPLEQEARARRVAEILNIPFIVFNLEKEFKKRIVDSFLKESKKGLTPNPCVICNKEIKFGLLLKKAFSLRADFLATGHYAKIDQLANIKKGSYRLMTAKDKEKDQSYFLWKLRQAQLKKTLFPLGNFTRTEVEKLAKKFKLPFSGVKKSQEICFVPGKVEDFLKRRLRAKRGLIATKNGRTIGKHQGLWFYTIGQRKGIGLPAGPYYVSEKDLKNNCLIVTKDKKDLLKREITAKDVNWISGKEPELPLRTEAAIRYRHKPSRAVIIKKLKFGTYDLKFEKPQPALTPGQSVVFYKGREIVGGGIIC